MLKQALIVFYLLFTLTYLSAQKNPTAIYGTVAVDSVTSMDATEVTVREWMLFIINNDFSSDLFPNPSGLSTTAGLLFEDLRKKRGLEFIQIAYNSRLLQENYGNRGFELTKKFKEVMESETGYFSVNIPITGVSFKQAKLFCAWREAVVNRYKTVKIKVSLPGIEDYKKVNLNKDSLCKPELKCGACMGYQFNYKHPKCMPDKTKRRDKHQVETQGQGLLRADSYMPSVYGLYNIQGNAAEMTSTEGIAAGGSFRHYAQRSYSDQTQAYQKEEDWLGFRCLITLQ